ncbi:MAG: hypothetical protein IPL10_06090 [Bacteroidetes bacterium]|nr:hypothetical protein [Bacteroidota bacterium]
MKILAILFLSLIFITSYGQAPEFNGHTWQAPYHLSNPTNWGAERFPIPVGFAPQIPYKGVEDIRFTPGWAKAASDEYWTYAFLWYLDGDVKIDVKTIESNLKLYYTGLITANGSTISTPILTSFKEITKDSNDLKTYLGTISLLDYMAKQPMVLNCKVHIASCTDKTKTFIFYELSPKPLSHIIWQSLDALWTEFKCKK